MEFHQIANIFPIMSDNEIEALAQDIRKNGLIEPIVTFEENILDGRNRYLACIKANANPRYKPYVGIDPISFVISLNLNRRHLNESQRAIVAAKLANMEPHRPEIKSANLPTYVSQPEASRLLNVSDRTIRDAKFIIREAPEEVKNIERGAKTIHQVKREIKRIDARQNLEKQSLELPDDKFQVLCADPPWRYDFAETESRAIENQYPTMSTEEICLLSVPAADNAVLFLWATAPKLREALQTMESWGFRYKSNAVWDKERLGMGYWFRGQHELLLVGTKGTFSPPPESDRVGSVIKSPRKEHSEKPDEVYKIIEGMFPGLTRVELFARKKRDGWESWPKVK